MTADTKTLETSSTLKISSTDELRKELGLNEPHANRVSTASDLDAKADSFVSKLLEFDPAQMDAREDRKASVETMALQLQKEAARQSELLNEPIKKLTQRGADGGEVANALLDLKMRVEELDPGKFDFEPGWFTRTLGFLPGVGTPLKKYFSRFESAQTVIAAIVRSLEGGRDQLSRDNVTLTEDQKRMREMTIKLEKAVQLGQLIDQKLQYRLERDIPAEDPKHKFVSEELLFPLRQRIMDLQQQLAVNQQGVLATELIIRNNKELIRGVNRALNVTISALQVGATVAMALANQKITLDKLDSVNKTTSDLIKGTAERLKTQGVEIQKRASSAQLDMEALKSSFRDLQTAMKDLSQFRMNALPQMAQTVLELDQLTNETAKTIEEMEKGNRSRPEVTIEIE